ncbi:serine/threonine-protein kinase [Amycolatopsis samaneae]|uniref:non-specific serine/threonine protein kinase n=1 Tax=Amycolatopsis samaneae TaxID=664691 RepID=A0ABW5G641_9PSEU
MSEQPTRPHEPAPTAPGARVVAGRYVLLAELGRGGMGVVWRAQDQVIGRHVAIKELRLPDAEGHAVFSERVLREVRAGGRLNDPAVVTVFDVITDGGVTYIVMELVEAPTLADLVRRHGPLPDARIAQIGERVLSALQAAHAAGIVHRDVKPANIMVAPDGRVKLTDFGIAHAVDDPRITTSGMIVGSPAFMAPERVEGREALPESDLWSLGATLFFAVEGLVPFERPTTAATLHAIMTEVPYLTRGHGPLAAAIHGLLVAKPEARLTAVQARQLFATAAAQGGAYTPPHGGTALLPPGGPTRVAPGQSTTDTKPDRRAWWLSAAAVLLVAGLVGGFFFGRAVTAPEVDKAMQPTATYGIDGMVKQAIGSTSRDCYNVTVQPGAVIGNDNEVSCDRSHTLEVYELGEVIEVGSNYTDKDAVVARYPGADAVNRVAEARCGLVFNSTVVPETQRSGLTYRALVPSEAEWNRVPDENKRYSRGFYCLLARTDGGQMSAQIHTKVK